jgi:hypothetical protein
MICNTGWIHLTFLFSGLQRAERGERLTVPAAVCATVKPKRNRE